MSQLLIKAQLANKPTFHLWEEKKQVTAPSVH